MQTLMDIEDYLLKKDILNIQLEDNHLVVMQKKTIIANYSKPFFQYSK